MYKLDNKQLATDLIEWFKTADFKDKNFMSRDPVLNVIKKELNKRKRWKELSRGKPGFPKNNGINNSGNTNYEDW